MRSLLQQLENNEAILLLYTAGELPPEDRAEVEQMLARDPALRAALEDLRALEQGTAALCAAADAVAPRPRVDAAVRRLAPVLARYAADAAAPPAPAPRRRLHVGWWAYPVAAAAAIVIGLILWAIFAPAPSFGPPAGPQFVDVATPRLTPDDTADPNLVALSQLERRVRDELDEFKNEPLSFRDGDNPFVSAELDR